MQAHTIMYVYIYICIYIHTERSGVYMYTHIHEFICCMHLCVCSVWCDAGGMVLAVASATFRCYELPVLAFMMFLPAALTEFSIIRFLDRASGVRDSSGHGL